jgi:tetratricopeptide (TPR) repeat protein
MIRQSNRVPVLYFFIKGTQKLTASNPIGILTELLGQLAFHPAFDPLKADLEKMVIQITTIDSSIQPVRYFTILRNMFLKLAKVTGHFYCVIDGLDECDRPPEIWDNFLAFLVELGTMQDAVAKLAVFSRDDRDFFKSFRPAKPFEYAIEHKDVDDDIKIVVSNDFQKTVVRRQLPKAKEDEIVKTIVEKARGIFLWAKSVIQHIDLNYLGEDWVTHIDTLPSNMHLLYDQILRSTRERIGEMDLAKQRRIVSLVMSAPSPVRLKEVAYAEVPTLDPALEDLEEVPLAQRILSLCAPLVQISGDTVELVHISAKEYLNREEHDTSETGSFYLSDKAAHTETAKLCLQYLQGDFFETPYADLDLDKIHFVRYAASWWCLHLSRAGKDGELLKQFEVFIESPQSSNWLDAAQKVLEQEDFCANFRYLFLLNYRIQKWIRQFHSNEKSDIFTNLVISKYEKNYNIAKHDLGRIEAELEETQNEIEKAKLAGNRLKALVRMLQRANELSEAYGWPAGGNLKAEAVLCDVLPIAERELEPAHDATIALIRNLAWNYKRQGKYKDAEFYLRTLIQVKEQWVHYNIGPDSTIFDDPDGVFIIDSLGWVYNRLNNWNEAAKCLERAVEGTEKELGRSRAQHSVASRLTLRTRFTLAEVYRKQGHAEKAHPERQKELYSKADKLLDDIYEVLPHVQKKLSPEDSMTFANFKAGIEMERGKYQAAATSYHDLAKNRAKVWGSNLHPSVLWAMQQEAVAYERDANLEEAIQVFLRILPLQEKVLLPDHPNTLETITHLWAIFEETRKSRYTNTRWDIVRATLPVAFRAVYFKIRNLIRKSTLNVSSKIRHATAQLAAIEIKFLNGWANGHVTATRKVYLFQFFSPLFLVMAIIFAVIVFRLHPTPDWRDWRT